jgi:uncharacterized protein
MLASLSVFARCISTWLLLALVLVNPVLAANDLPDYRGFVNDYAGVLQPQERIALQRLCQQIRDSSSNEIAVAIFPSLDGRDIKDFTGELARKWKVGGAKNNNGVLIGIFVQEKKIRIEVGYGLEGAIPDARAFRIIKEDIQPNVLQGKYFEGLAIGVVKIGQLAVGEYREPIKRNKNFTAQQLYIALGVVAFIILIIALVVYFDSKRRKKRPYGRGNDYYDDDRGGGGFFFFPTFWGGGYGGGGGGGYDNDSGGGFDDFGGGDFGGGGADD